MDAAGPGHRIVVCHIASLNESTLLGLGAPSYMAVSNSLKFIVLLIGLPLSFRLYGFPGAVMALSLVEACRYFPYGSARNASAFPMPGRI